MRNKFCGHYAISEYIENKFEDTLPKELSNRAENRRLIDWFDNKFHKEVSKIIINESRKKMVTGKRRRITKHR